MTDLSRAPDGLSTEAQQVLQDINPWWRPPHRVRPDPPEFHRPLITSLLGRLRRPKGLIEVVRGPRQVGKTTGIHQLIRGLLLDGWPAADILFVRFDLEPLRSEPASLRRILRWFAETIRRRALAEGKPAFVFLDEVHKLRAWSEEVKHAWDTFPLRMLLTGSSSVLVARGGRESLAGRVFTTELPTFSLRELLEWTRPDLASFLPDRLRFDDAFEMESMRRSAESMRALRAQQKLALHRLLERFYARGGYPRLHSGEVEDDRWADYLVQTVFENVLGSDIPALFPVENPNLLRFIYLQVARQTGTEMAQTKIAEASNQAGMRTNQVTVGNYLRYLVDALLVREFRRYPLAKKATSRLPSKITLSDLGVRNAVLRNVPSLGESDPTMLGPLVETLVQGVIRDHNLAVHFFRDFEKPGDRRTPVREVDFVAERVDGTTLPIEVKFRRNIRADDWTGLRLFMGRYDAPYGILVTRDASRWDESTRILHVPLLDFLLTF